MAQLIAAHSPETPGAREHDVVRIGRCLRILLNPERHGI
jgi:hypothetical protein